MSDDPLFLSISPEFERLSKECELLKEELAALFTEREHILQAVIPGLEAEYVLKIGSLQHELLQVQIDIQRTKREIEIRQAALNRGVAINERQVTIQLEQEFAQWTVELDAQVKKIRDAQQQLSHLMSSDDYTELRKLYRTLAKKLHPDVNPDQSEQARNLWLQVQSAYEQADLKQLQALHLLADEIPDSYDLPNSLDILKKRRDDFKDQIKLMLQKMAELKKLPVFKWEQCLKDPQLVCKEQQAIREQIAQAQGQHTILSAVLTQMKQGLDNE
ncbi:MAG: DnaJ domain-containing protein [Armatimonadota bacterium]